MSFYSGMLRYTPTLLPELPTHVEVEPTTRCNATCGTCSRSSLARDDMKNDLLPATMERILSSFPNLKSLRLVGLGEIFLNPKIETILQQLKARNIKVWIITNGSLLQQQRIRDLIHDYIYEVGISIDSTDPAEFARLRPMGKMGLTEVIDGTQALLAERNAGRSNVIIGINNTITHENYHNLPALGSLCLTLGVDYLAISFVENWLMQGDPGHKKASTQIQQALTQLPSIRRAIIKQQIRLGLRGIIVGYKIPRRRIGACHWPYRSTHITAEGHVTPCCTRMQPNHAMFNINTDDFAQHWNGPEYQALRLAHMNKDALNPMCGSCPL
ncbi:MAG: SPASM domain-containing protein [Pseudomonadales bacterium]|nr:SPASM domain-containing protein [Pseudomonadales bacterium]